MKATITKVPSKTPSIKYADLKAGTLYNYTVRHGGRVNRGIIFIAAEVDDGTPRIVELDGQDAGMIWSEKAYGNFIFTPFNDSISLANT